jgi:hypothetical protein
MPLPKRAEFARHSLFCVRRNIVSVKEQPHHFPHALELQPVCESCSAFVVLRIRGGTASIQKQPHHFLVPECRSLGQRGLAKVIRRAGQRAARYQNPSTTLLQSVPRREVHAEFRAELTLEQSRET